MGRGAVEHAYMQVLEMRGGGLEYPLMILKFPSGTAASMSQLCGAAKNQIFRRENNMKVARDSLATIRMTRDN